MNTLSRLLAIAAAILLSSTLLANTRVVQEVELGGQKKPAAGVNNDTISQEIVVSSNPKVELTTSKGIIIIELFPDKAPTTVQNFLAYVKSGYYNNTIFHRVIPNLLVQGGAYTPDYRIKADRGFIQSEANNGLSNKRGMVSAARRANDSESASSQFFINVVDNPQFDYTGATSMSARGYAVFGQIIKGQDIIDGMRATPTGKREPLGDSVPKTPIIISQAKLLD